MQTTQYHQDNNTPESLLLTCIKCSVARRPLTACALNLAITSPIITILLLTLEPTPIMPCLQHHKTYSMPSTACHAMDTAPSIKELLATLCELINHLVDVLPTTNPSHPKQSWTNLYMQIQQPLMFPPSHKNYMHQTPTKLFPDCNSN